MRFWDASAVVPLLVRQGATAAVSRALRADPVVVVWWGTPVECESALSRLERDGSIAAGPAATARRRLVRLSAAWSEVQPVPAVRDRALRLLRVHDLRAGDALQLAAALAASEEHPEALPFLCLDARLSRAASREGFPVEGSGTA